MGAMRSKRRDVAASLLGVQRVMPPLLVPGRNVWQRAHADHVALLVDGAAYFETLAHCLAQAQHSVFILGWDMDTRIHLGRGLVGFPEEMSAFFDTLVRNRPELTIRILLWDYSAVYLMEREVLPALKFGTKTHQRVRFELDDNLPTFAAHHQKVIVIDDAIAFAGGLDLTDHRWDTPGHFHNDPARATLNGELYSPFHDVQSMCDGAAARALGELARERWRRVTDENVAHVAGASTPLVTWPAQVTPDFTDVQVGIARTDPAHDGRPLVRETEQLHFDAIAAAERLIYIENQYLSSEPMCDALIARLTADVGPHIVIVIPVCGDGWIESQTIAAAHLQNLARMRAADRHRRLRILHAMVPHELGAGQQAVFIHAKILIIDDRLWRVGSANMTNRSFGVDTECDIAIEALPGETRVALAIARARARMLAEHLGMSIDEVIAATNDRGVLALIDERQHERRTLLEAGDDLCASPSTKPGATTPQPTVMAFADPRRPVTPESVLATMLPGELQERARFPYVRLVSMLAMVVGLVLLWRLTPLARVTRLDALLATLTSLKTMPLAPLIAFGAFVLATQLFVPLNLLIVASVCLFGPWVGASIALLGTCAAATIAYATGAALGGDLVRRLAGRRLMALRKRLDRARLLPIVALRIIPVAPAQIISLAAGAWRLRFRSFLLATFVGALPGVLTLAVLGRSLAAVFARPNALTITWLVVFASAVIAMLLWMRSFLRRRRRHTSAFV